MLAFYFAFVLANYLPRCISIFWHYLAPLIGPLGLLLLFNSIQDLRILNYFSFWGQNSLNLMVTHYSIVLVILTLIVEDFFHMPYSGWVSILCFVVSMPIQYLLVILIDKFARFTLGNNDETDLIIYYSEKYCLLYLSIICIQYIPIESRDGVSFLKLAVSALCPFIIMIYSPKIGKTTVLFMLYYALIIVTAMIHPDTLRWSTVILWQLL